MMTPRERAEKIVYVGPCSGLHAVYAFGYQLTSASSRRLAEQVADGAQSAIVEAIEGASAGAVHAHLAAVTPEGPATAEEIAEAAARRCKSLTSVACDADRASLACVIRHQRELIARLMNDSDAYAAGLEQGRREKAKVVEVLRSVEWEAVNIHDLPACPCCYRSRGDGHRDDCKLAAMVKEVA